MFCSLPDNIGGKFDVEATSIVQKCCVKQHLWNVSTALVDAIKLH